MSTINVTQELRRTKNLEREFKSIMLNGPSVAFYRFVLEQYQETGQSEITEAELLSEIGRLVANDVAEILVEAEAE